MIETSDACQCSLNLSSCRCSDCPLMYPDTRGWFWLRFVVLFSSCMPGSVTVAQFAIWVSIQFRKKKTSQRDIVNNLMFQNLRLVLIALLPGGWSADTGGAASWTIKRADRSQQVDLTGNIYVCLCWQPVLTKTEAQCCRAFRSLGTVLTGVQPLATEAIGGLLLCIWIEKFYICFKNLPTSLCPVVLDTYDSRVAQGKPVERHNLPTNGVASCFSSVMRFTTRPLICTVSFYPCSISCCCSNTSPCLTFHAWAPWIYWKTGKMAPHSFQFKFLAFSGCHIFEPMESRPSLAKPADSSCILARVKGMKIFN